jgi:O-antigen ligase
VNARTNAWWLGSLSVLVALMPLSFCVPLHVKALPALLLLITGLFLIFSRADTRASYRAAWPIVAVGALGVIYTALNILGHGLGWDEFDLPSHILLYLGTAAVFSLPLRMRWVWLGFSATAIFLGIVCIEQHFVLRIDRAFGLNGGDWGAIEFAMVLLVLSLSAWQQLFYASRRLLEKIVHGLGAMLGMYGAMLTQSRGPLLAFVPVLLLMMVIYARRTGRWRRALILLVAIIGGGALAASSVHNVSIQAAAEVSAATTATAAAVDSNTPATKATAAGNVSARPDKVVSERSATASSSVSPSATASNTSVFVKRFADVGSEMTSYNSKTDARGAIRERLEMWHTAAHAFADHPLAGVGIDQFGVYARQQVAEGRANAAIAKYEHPHNEYLEAAATGGTPGLLIIGLIFAMPFIHFIRHALHAPDSEIIPACVGVATVSMYALCGLTDNVFYRAMPHSLYFFLVLGLAIRLGRHQSSTEVAQLV